MNATPKTPDHTLHFEQELEVPTEHEILREEFFLREGIYEYLNNRYLNPDFEFSIEGDDYSDC